MNDKNKSLLIVEDDEGIQSQLRWCFDQYDVVISSDRQDAIVQLRRYTPGVVLLDLGLPPDPGGVRSNRGGERPHQAGVRYCRYPADQGGYPQNGARYAGAGKAQTPLVHCQYHRRGGDHGFVVRQRRLTIERTDVQTDE